MVETLVSAKLSEENEEERLDRGGAADVAASPRVAWELSTEGSSAIEEKRN
jgi:hypothetical protein